MQESVLLITLRGGFELIRNKIKTRTDVESEDRRFVYVFKHARS